MQRLDLAFFQGTLVFFGPPQDPAVGFRLQFIYMFTSVLKSVAQVELVQSST
jgi:hypothetical protein